MNNTTNISRQKTAGSHLEEIESRAEKRVERSLLMTIFDCEVKTKNISPGGVYFEVITKDVENYSLGKEAMVYIEGICSKRRVWITGFGLIVRIDDKGFVNHDKKLGVALKFIKEPNVFF
jgi:hypothetical protein